MPWLCRLECQTEKKIEKDKGLEKKKKEEKGG